MKPFQELDFYCLDELLDQAQRAVRSAVREFVTAEVLPIVADAFDRAQFPTQWYRMVGERGWLGPMTPVQFGGAGADSISYGLICQELERGDSGLRSFASVQGSLVMYPILSYGSDEQKATWLPQLATGSAIGCFGLTEPGYGSNPGGMQTRCRRHADGWILEGRKRWATNGCSAQLALVWAKDEEGVVRGFLIETDRPGVQIPEITKKWSFRASVSSAIELDGVRIPDTNRLPGVQGLKGPLSCLTQARFGIAWGVLGAAQACFDEVLHHCLEREVFDKPLAAYQLTQQKLADMASEITKAQLMVWRLSQLKEAGKMTPAQVSMAKRDNVAMALDVARQCRTLLGANGVTLEYQTGRHLCNLETVLTYEGTHEIHTLAIGQALTGLAAFR